MTATPKDTAKLAKERADALHGTNRMVRGDIVPMMLAAGFNPGQAAATMNVLTVKLRADMLTLVKKDDLADTARRNLAALNNFRKKGLTS